MTLEQGITEMSKVLRPNDFKRYALYSSPKCGPCIIVKQYLDRNLPNWEDKIEKFDTSVISREEWSTIKQKYNVPCVPFIVDKSNESVFMLNYKPLKLEGLCNSLKTQ